MTAQVAVFSVVACLIGTIGLGQRVWAQAADAVPEALDLPRLDDVVIDGDASDWGDGGLRLDLMVAEDGSALASDDFHPRVRLGWTAEGLLILATVRDDVPAEAVEDKDIWQHDSVDVFVAEGWGASRYYQVLVSSGADPQYGRPRHAFNPRTLVLEELPEFKIDLASHVDPEQGLAVVEMLLPWSNLKIERGVGDEIAVQIWANDSDEPDTAAAGKPAADKYRAVWFPSEASDNDTKLMVRLRLAEGASPPICLRADADYDEHGMVAVEVVGCLDLAGQTIRLVDGMQPIADVVLEADGAVARAHRALPPAGEGRPFDALSVGVEGDADSRQLVYPRPQELQVVLTEADASEATSTGKREVRAKLKSTDAVVAGTSVTIEARGYGRAPGVGHGEVGEPIALIAEPGAYVVSAETVDAFGRTLRDDEAILVGMTVADALTEARQRTAGPAFAAYHGLIENRIDRVQHTVGTMGILMSPQDALLDLLRWVQRLEADPQVLATLRGRHEWAYLSRVDGSGQPFAIHIPEGYDPSRAWPLHIFLHGNRGTHSNWTPTPAEQRSGAIHVAALGRSRTSGWEGLGEVDVLELIDYVKAHWHIDADRVHLVGASMGGDGTFELAARYPDLFASARPECGYGLHVPLENLRSLPLYALHGSEDQVVPISQSRLAVERLSRLGGHAVLDIGEGFGHAIRGFEEGLTRSLAWTADLRRPRQDAIDDVNYTATDGLASGAWWVDVMEWGADHGPAKIGAHVDDGNHLYVDLENVTTARFDLAAAPIDRERAMHVYVNQRLSGVVESPLPAVLYVTRASGDATADGKGSALGNGTEGGWRITFEAPSLPDHRLRFPGGPMALYQGEPIMIVWGTGGDEATTEALRKIAEINQRSARPGWSGDERDHLKRWVHKSWYGPLPAKADIDVTDADIDRYNLVLLGTAEQNKVVARLASALPVRLDGDAIQCDDGVAWPFADRAFSLVYYNPLAPRRLIHWIAADDIAFYKPGRGVPWDSHTWDGIPDLAIGGASAEQLVGGRNFDSRWRWHADYAESPLLSKAECTYRGYSMLVGEALRRLVGADFAVAGSHGEPDAQAWLPGQTRAADLLVLPWSRNSVVFTLTAEELRAAAAGFDGTDPSWACHLVPALDEILPLDADDMKADAGRRYRVVVSDGDMRAFVKQAQLDPPDAQLIDLSVVDGLRWYFEHRPHASRLSE